MEKLITLSSFFFLTNCVPQTPPVYNGNLQYFIADVAPGYPCHKNYFYDDTWFFADDSTNNWQHIRKILDGLSLNGFNAIRLPMWPEDKRVNGPNPQDPNNPKLPPYNRT